MTGSGRLTTTESPYYSLCYTAPLYRKIFVPLILYIRQIISYVTKCCIYNQFSVAFILHSIKAYFFTCSYFRILYSVLHLKNSSTSMRAKLDDLNSIHTLVQLNISERLHSSNKKLIFQFTWRVFPPQWRNNF